MRGRTQTTHEPLTRIALAISLSLPIAVIAQTKVDPQSPQPQNSRPQASQPAQAIQKGGAAGATLSEADRKFVQDAAMGGMMEVELGKVALQRSSNDQVRQLAQRIVDDHTQANERLQSLARSKGIEIPTQLDSKHQKEIDKLQKVSAKDFDSKYAALMVSDHKKDIKAFQHEAERASDPGLKEFATMTLPKLESHLAMAQSAKKTAGGTFEWLLRRHAGASRGEVGSDTNQTSTQ